jgi:hypothetical protein
MGAMKVKSAAIKPDSTAEHDHFNDDDNGADTVTQTPTRPLSPSRASTVYQDARE